MTDLDEPLKYCLYARKSSESDEKQAMSIDSQIYEMLQIAKQEKLAILEIMQESKSAKAKGVRVKFNEMLKGLGDGKFNSIREKRFLGNFGGPTFSEKMGKFGSKTRKSSWSPHYMCRFLLMPLRP